MKFEMKLTMIKKSFRWPKWPILDVMNGPDDGVIIDGEGPIVYIYESGAGTMEEIERIEEIKKLPKREYETFTALFEDGWEFAPFSLC